MDIKIQTVLDTLDSLVATSTPLGTPSEAVQEKVYANDPRMFSNEVVQPKPQVEVSHAQIFTDGVGQSELQIEVDPSRLFRDGVEHSELQAEVDSYQIFSNEV